MKKTFNLKPLHLQTKHSEQALRDVEAMIRQRFSGSDWTSRFEEFRSDNEKRKGE